MTGLEPNETLNKICKKLLKGRKNVNVTRDSGERIPFENDKFDLVICYTVLEHVQDYKILVNEMLRVLKPKGKLYLYIPNYLYPYEGHYDVFFPSILGKNICSLYLNLRGINPNFYKTDIFHRYSVEVKRYLNSRNTQVNDISKQTYINSKNLFKKVLGFFDLYPNMEYIVEKSPKE